MIFGLFFLLSVVVVCMFLFSMALLYVRVIDVRTSAKLAREEEAQKWEKYTHITQQEAISSLTDHITSVIRQELGVRETVEKITTQFPEARANRIALGLADSEYDKFLIENEYKKMNSKNR